ncbi:aminotransferase class V-fold PLP-dependent enzyme [Runella aurantiaca]|uniref:Aminotransferase class V-fold PLP-dependent enzyme n=1 Tax=Runella aurantiaca TaxID=2282308 RepID=A0A369I2K4_9BACT|nr:aminotransferase class V-fold PLP-dependent enzyme [Runella aurantiaca]RDB02485.1 aminotransferase class V-fold PLP-dependent enzyme [Runella aurantiaca]
MFNRRQFLGSLGTAAGALTLPPFLAPAEAQNFETLNRQVAHLAPLEAAQNEDFWAFVKTEYTVSPNLLNLNNGGVCPQPRSVQDAHIRFYQYCNEAPSYYMWRILDQGRESLRSKLADLAGCSAEEVAINRNATEGLNTVIFGLDLKPGDEVVLTKQDYPNMINAWKQREKRDGIKLVWINLDLPQENDAYFVDKYVSAFTSRTKVVHVTHMINWIGQTVPVRKIADEAHKRGIEVIADGAHTFALLDFKIPDLGCDYYATSLHKWLGAPFGSGLMYVKKDKISKVWALLSNNEPDGPDIRKFESLGTRSFASEMAIGTAVDFQLSLGAARKQARAHYLQRYWTDKARQIPGVKIHTSPNPNYACAIALVSVEGLKTSEVDSQLYNKFKIHTTGIEWENIKGVRVTPHVYHTPKDLDRLVNGLDEIASASRRKS